MLNKYTLFLTMVFMSLVATTAQAEGYTLHQGDTLQVSVWGEDKLQSPSLVLPDGSITYPLAGNVQVVGLSAPEVEAQIAEKLKPYLPDPHVSVVVTKIDGNKAYVMGKVSKPGEIQLAGPMTVLQALSVAGGFEKFADKKGIKILRESGKGRKVIPVPNYEELINGKNLNGNYKLISGDTILVP